MNSTGDFVTDLIVVMAFAWLFMLPMVAGEAVLAFFAWRRQREVDRLYGPR